MKTILKNTFMALMLLLDAVIIPPAAAAAESDGSLATGAVKDSVKGYDKAEAKKYEKDHPEVGRCREIKQELNNIRISMLKESTDGNTSLAALYQQHDKLMAEYVIIKGIQKLRTDYGEHLAYMKTATEPFSKEKKEQLPKLNSALEEFNKGIASMETILVFDHLMSKMKLSSEWKDLDSDEKITLFIDNSCASTNTSSNKSYYGPKICVTDETAKNKMKEAIKGFAQAHKTLFAATPPGPTDAKKKEAINELHLTLMQKIDKNQLMTNLDYAKKIQAKGKKLKVLLQKFQQASQNDSPEKIQEAEKTFKAFQTELESYKKSIVDDKEQTALIGEAAKLHFEELFVSVEQAHTALKSAKKGVYNMDNKLGSQDSNKLLEQIYQADYLKALHEREYNSQAKFPNKADYQGGYPNLLKRILGKMATKEKNVVMGQFCPLTKAAKFSVTKLGEQAEVLSDEEQAEECLKEMQDPKYQTAIAAKEADINTNLKATQEKINEILKSNDYRQLKKMQESLLVLGNEVCKKAGDELSAYACNADIESPFKQVTQLLDHAGNIIATIDNSSAKDIKVDQDKALKALATACKSNYNLAPSTCSIATYNQSQVDKPTYADYHQSKADKYHSDGSKRTSGLEMFGTAAMSSLGRGFLMESPTSPGLFGLLGNSSMIDYNQQMAMNAKYMNYWGGAYGYGSGMYGMPYGGGFASPGYYGGYPAGYNPFAASSFNAANRGLFTTGYYRI